MRGRGPVAQGGLMRILRSGFRVSGWLLEAFRGKRSKASREWILDLSFSCRAGAYCFVVLVYTSNIFEATRPGFHAFCPTPGPIRGLARLLSRALSFFCFRLFEVVDATHFTVCQDV